VEFVRSHIRDCLPLYLNCVPNAIRIRLGLFLNDHCYNHQSRLNIILHKSLRCIEEKDECHNALLSPSPYSLGVTAFGCRTINHPLTSFSPGIERKGLPILTIFKHLGLLFKANGKETSESYRRDRSGYAPFDGHSADRAECSTCTY
jgi:hypothetical protein